ncbi:MAG: exodeoxyribonuclease VII small subunit [Candidatus Aphodosoma sp.]
MATYDEQMAQLEKIVNEIESGEMSIDRLTAQVTKAGQLLASLKEQLTKVEKDVNDVIKTFDTTSAAKA